MSHIRRHAGIHRVFRDACFGTFTESFLSVRETEENVLNYGQTVCWVRKTGSVDCEMLTKYSIHCIGDNTWWPYNVMVCTLQFGSWSHSVDEINLILDKNLVLSFVYLRLR